MSQKVVDAFADSGLFWLFLPKDLGGGGVPFSEGLAVFEEISRADGSTGWGSVANALSVVIAGALLTAEGFDKLYPDGEKSVIAGFGLPFGTGRKVDGGYIIQSKFMPFGSGTQHTTRVVCGVRVVDEDGEQVYFEDGQPDIRIAYPPTSTVKFHGNWDVMGLKGTGSVDYEVPQQFIEDDFISTAGLPQRQDDIFRWGYMGATYFFHTSFALGTLKRGFEEISRIVKGKRRGQLPVTLDEYGPFLYEFGKKEATYQAARAYAFHLIESFEKEIGETGALSELSLTRMAQLSAWLHAIGGELMDFCYLWAGSEPIRNSSALGRAFRDFRVAQNHVFADPSMFADTAKPILATWQNGTAGEA
ncbi:acyl-CoA dehydrogenase family protein [soil metagenome]